MKAKALSRRRPRPAFCIAAVLRNESHRLPGLLKSLEEFRDRGGRIAVLDTGSEDATPSMAREAGCAVHIEPTRFHRRLTEKEVDRIHEAFAKGGEGPFLEPGQVVFNLAAARNHLARRPSQDFQLAVDGSDLVEVMDLDCLDRLVGSADCGILLFETRRLHKEHWYLENRDYFYDRRRTHWHGRSHSFVVSSRGDAVPSRVLPRDTLRVTHHTDSGKSRDHQLAGIALDALDAPLSPSRALSIGNELAVRGHHKSALEACLAVDRPDFPPSFRSAALSMAAACLSEIRSTFLDDEIAGLLFRAARRDPSRRGPLLQLAQRSVSIGDWQRAVSFASAALAIPGTVGLSEAEGHLQETPHAILYWALLWLGRHEEAKPHLARCLAMDPDNRRYREHARFLP